jgi:hypothetical protein
MIKLNITTVIQYKDGVEIARFNSVYEAAKLSGCKLASIYRVLKGLKNITGGYEWKYE